MSLPIVRRLSIDLNQGLARRWFAGDAFMTQVFNATSMTFPQGEQYFIDSVRDALPSVTSPELRAQIRAFIGQEAAHRHLHAQYNRQLERQGLRYILERWIAFRIRVGSGYSLLNRLAITAAFEHHTALFARRVLGGDWDLTRADPLPRLLWSWHSAEELEHRAVAFDVYRHLGGGTLRRSAWFIYSSLLFSIDLAVQSAHNLHRDGSLWRWRTARSALGFVVGRRGHLWALIPHALAYMRPGFHPDRQGGSELASAWFDRHRIDFQPLPAAPDG